MSEHDKDDPMREYEGEEQAIASAPRDDTTDRDVAPEGVTHSEPSEVASEAEEEFEYDAGGESEANVETVSRAKSWDLYNMMIYGGMAIVIILVVVVFAVRMMPKNTGITVLPEAEPVTQPRVATKEDLPIEPLKVDLDPVPLEVAAPMQGRMELDPYNDGLQVLEGSYDNDPQNETVQRNGLTEPLGLEEAWQPLEIDENNGLATVEGAIDESTPGENAFAQTVDAVDMLANRLDVAEAKIEKMAGVLVEAGGKISSLEKQLRSAKAKVAARPSASAPSRTPKVIAADTFLTGYTVQSMVNNKVWLLYKGKRYMFGLGDSVPDAGRIVAIELEKRTIRTTTGLIK